MTAVSVVIVSNGRPAHLRACLQSLRHQTHRNFEVVVVADALPAEFAGQLRYIPFDVENISAARNLGIAHAAGGIVAFCDDDAIPDPLWLQRLVAPLCDPAIGASGGFTRGRNGVSLQWRASRFDTAGVDRPFDMGGDDPKVFPPDPQNPVKLVGTNMAFRKDALEQVGGFDESYRFYLEDADIKLRLDQLGWKSALVPRAQVHHGFAASKRRTGQRVPRTLYEIGASQACFCARHFDGDPTSVLNAFSKAQKTRLQALIRRRLLTRSAADALLDELQAGMAAGAKRAPRFLQPVPAPSFQPFPATHGPRVLLCARPGDRRWAQQKAQALLANGCTVSVLQLGLSARFFQTVFQDGYWQHTGGLFGRARRNEPFFRFSSYARRFEHEIIRLGMLGDFTLVARANRGDYTPDDPCLAPLRACSVKQLTSARPADYP